MQTYTDREIHRHRQTDRQTDRGRETDTEREMYLFSWQ